jgi:hypothetical protein
VLSSARRYFSISSEGKWEGMAKIMAIKTWFAKLRRYSNTIGGTLVISLLAANYWISNYLNPVPQVSELRRYSVTITHSYLRGQHFLATGSDGRSQAFLLPQPFNFTGKASYYPGVNPDIQKSWIGCQATLQGVPVRFSLNDQIRVWSLKCKDYELTFTELNNNFIKYEQNGSGIIWIGHIGFIFVIWIGYLVDRRQMKLTKR